MRAQLQQVPKVSLGQNITQRGLQAIDILAASLEDLNGIVRAQLQQNPFLKAKHHNKGHVIDGSSDEPYIIESVAQPIGLAQHLSAQAALFKLDVIAKKSVYAIINSLDESGYLRIPLYDLSAVTELPVKKLEQALYLVQNLEPAGVGARNLAECFALQLKATNRLTSELRNLLKNIDKINTMSQDNLAILCGVKVDSLVDMVRMLRSLDPCPGRQFAEDPPVYITPDVVLFKNSDSSLGVQINSENKLQVYFDKKYFDQIYAQTSREDDKNFLHRCYRDAHNLINDIEQRDSSIIRVTNYIVNKQQIYFKELGPLLKSITQREVARNLNIHESTVSRIVANKYINHRGKTVALQNFVGNSASVSDTISVHIQRLIQNETAESVLSDEDIAQLLKKCGITVARRTVAKYRSELKIPSSSQRRKKWVMYV